MAWLWDPRAWTKVEELAGHLQGVLDAAGPRAEPVGPEARARIEDRMHVIRQKRQALDSMTEFEAKQPGYGGRGEVFLLYASIEKAALQGFGAWLQYREGLTAVPEAGRSLEAWSRSLREASGAVQARRKDAQACRERTRACAMEAAALEETAAAVEAQGFEGRTPIRTILFWTRLLESSRQARQAAGLLHKMLSV